VIYSYNESQRDALFLRFFFLFSLHVSDTSTVHHQEYLNTVYTQKVFVILVLLASASVVNLMMDSGHVRNMQSTSSNKYEK
jgi:hypothetical protein